MEIRNEQRMIKHLVLRIENPEASFGPYVTDFRFN